MCPEPSTDDVRSGADDDIATRYAWLLADEMAGAEREAADLGLNLPVVSRADYPVDVGGRLSALVWGSEPASIFLHGGGLNAHSWDSVLIRLGIGAVAPDLPGHGDSSWRNDFDYRPEIVAASVARPLFEAVRQPTLLVGQSLGGLVATVLAATHPHRTAGLVLVDITPGRRADAPGSERIREFVQARRDFGSYEEVVDHAIDTGLGQNRSALERGVIQNTRVRSDARIVFKHHFGSPPPNAPANDRDITHLWEPLERLSVPTLLVRGTRGILDDQQFSEFRRRVPSARTVELSAGHNVQTDAPEELTEAIRSFQQSLKSP